MSEKVVVELDQYEHRAVANIINDRRKDMISKNKDVEFKKVSLLFRLGGRYESTNIYSYE